MTSYNLSLGINALPFKMCYQLKYVTHLTDSLSAIHCVCKTFIDSLLELLLKELIKNLCLRIDVRLPLTRSNYAKLFICFFVVQ